MTVKQTNSSRTTGALNSSALALKNPAIAKAIPGAIANEGFINALFKEAHNRNATKGELARFKNTTVKDAANIILGAARSPFMSAAIDRNAVPDAKSAEEALRVPARPPNPPTPRPSPPLTDTSKVSPGKPKIAETAKATPTPQVVASAPRPAPKPTVPALAPARPQAPPKAATVSTPKAPKNSAPAPVNRAPAKPVLSNPAIANANPGVIANPNFINALFREAYGRDANRDDLERWTGTPTYVKDAANIILGARSPFTNAVIDRGAVPGARSAEEALQAPSKPVALAAPPPKREPVMTIVQDRYTRPGSAPAAPAESPAAPAVSPAPPAEPAAPMLNNPAIASANPGAVANPSFINALYQEANGRNATARELGRWMEEPTYVKDAAAVILGDRSPFSNSEIDRKAVPGARSAEAARLAPSTPTAKEIAAQKAEEERRKAEEQEAARGQAMKQYERMYEAAGRLGKSAERELKDERKRLRKIGVSEEQVAAIEARVTERAAAESLPAKGPVKSAGKTKAAAQPAAGAPPTDDLADEFDRDKDAAMQMLKAHLGKAGPPDIPGILSRFTRAAESLGSLDGPARAARQRQIEDLADYLHFHRVAEYSKLRDICKKNDVVGEMREASASFEVAVQKFGGENSALSVAKASQSLPGADEPFEAHARATTSAIGAFLEARAVGRPREDLKDTQKRALDAFENAARAMGQTSGSIRKKLEPTLRFLGDQLQYYRLADEGTIRRRQSEGVQQGEADMKAPADKIPMGAFPFETRRIEDAPMDANSTGWELSRSEGFWDFLGKAGSHLLSRTESIAFLLLTDPDKRSKLEKLGIAERTKFEDIVSALFPKHVVALGSLRALLLTDSLTERSRVDGSTLLDQLHRYVARSTEGMCIEENPMVLLGDMLKELEHPEKIKQQARNTCVPTVVSMVLARSMPTEYVRLITDLATAGQARTMKGDVIQAKYQPDSLKTSDQGRTTTARLLQTTLMEYGDPDAIYDDPKDKQISATPDGTVESEGLSFDKGREFLESLTGRTVKPYSTGALLNTSTELLLNLNIETLKDLLGSRKRTGLWLVNDLKTNYYVEATGLDGDTVTYVDGSGRRGTMPLTEVRRRIVARTDPAALDAALGEAIPALKSGKSVGVAMLWGNINHYVLLDDVSANRVYFSNPQGTRESLTIAEFGRRTLTLQVQS